MNGAHLVLFPRAAVQMAEVIAFCHEQPEIRSWLDYFDDPAELEAVADGEDVMDGGGVAGAGDDKDISR